MAHNQAPGAGRGDWRAADWSAFTGRAPAAGVLSDFDGTLSPIVEDRDSALPLPGTNAALAALARRCRLVAVISGRPVAFLESVLPSVPGLLLVGLYGIERSQDGRRSVLPDARPWQAPVRRAVADACGAMPPGVEVEDKGLTLAVHCRKAPEAFGQVAAWAEEEAAATGLAVQPGKLAVELLPPVPMDKGRVVSELAAGLDAVLFIGDDVGDLPGFAAVRRMRRGGRKAVAVGVGSDEQPAELAKAVDYVLDGPEEALDLLRFLSDGAPPATAGH